MSRPVEIATKQTVEFIRAYAREKGNVLEIGCGEGDVAQSLGNFGFYVTAIDSNNDAVAAARNKNVNAFTARWPDFACDMMDAIIFTRSLHHIHDLTDAITGARNRLRKSGVLLIEDFGFYQADERTSGWFAAQLRSERVAALLSASPDSFAGQILAAPKAHDAWHSNHGHDLHSIDAMNAAIAAEFDITARERVPYLYRYLIPALPETAEAADIVENFFNAEEQMIASGDIIPIGRRIIASSKNGGPGNDD